MASVRLTDYLRDQICKAVIGDRFEAQRKKIAKERRSIALACYNKFYSRSIRAKMSALPDGWLPSESSIRVRLGGKHDYLQFDGSSYNSEIQKRFLAKDIGPVALDLEATDSITERYRSCEDESKDIDAAERRLRQEIRSVLYSVTTTGRLLAVWPEVEPFLSNIEPATVSVPAVPVAELNEKLGLAA